MSRRRRIPRTVILLGLGFLLLAIYLGGGLWGWGGTRGIDQAAAMPEGSAEDLVRKREEFLRIAEDGPPEQRKEAAARAAALQQTLDLWAEDSFLSAQAQVAALLEAGKKQEALDLLDRVPKEYVRTRFGPEFEALRRRVADS